jgi:hypothetical protein
MDQYKIDKYKRYQKGLALEFLFPDIESLCACGCGTPLSDKKIKWASADCSNNAYIKFAIIKGDIRIIRREVFKRDRGICNQCGSLDSRWQADHINPVCEGGGACELDNLQTLCLSCHEDKTEKLLGRRGTSKKYSNTPKKSRLKGREIYHLFVKDKNQYHFYYKLKKTCEEHPNIKVSIHTLYRYDFSSPYEDNYCIILKAPLLG